MSVQTRVLVNGRWTTVNVDIHQIMAGNRNTGEEQRSHTNGTFNAPKAPVLGVLTQTLVKSPVIKYMIPARIRHQKYNDVIFVYNNHVEIKEVVTEGYLRNLSVELRDIAIKSDFNSTIRAARVFGSPRKITASVQEPTGIDAIIKNEELPFSDNSDEYQAAIPPQILVLSLDSKKLVFLFAFHDTLGDVHFLSSQWPLPSGAAHNEQVGEYIAVDPKSRAMAVAAWEGSLTLYSLKPMGQLKEEVEVDGKLLDDQFMPVKSERHYQVEGTIIKMEFLHPQKGNEEHIILLLVVSQQGGTALMWFGWDLSETHLPHPNAKPRRQRIPQDEQLPLLLIPLTMSSAFMLICEGHITVYKDIMSDVATAYKQKDLDNLELPEEPGVSNKFPLWTQWARPMRGEEHRLNDLDDVYLCREDGVVRYLRIDDRRPVIDSSHRAGILEVNVDTAFASIDLGVHHTDLIAAGGNMCNGGLWIFPPRTAPVLKVAIPNWTPLIDYTAAHIPHSVQNNLGHPAQRNHASMNHSRIFACTGKGARHGAISEIRYGLEAFGRTLDVGNLSEGGILQIWALDHHSEASTYLLLAHPTTSSILLITSKGTELELEQLEESFGIDLDARTIAAGVTANGLVIQVTGNSINATSPTGHPPQFQSQCHEEHIVAASIERVKGKESVVLTAVRNNQSCHLHYGYFTSDDSRTILKQLGDPILLPSEPSCILIQGIWDQLFAFVATTEGKLLIFCADAGSSLSQVDGLAFGGPFAVCESIAVLTLRRDPVHISECILVCGLRNGTLQTIYLKRPVPSGNDILTVCETINIGSTSVSVATDKAKASRAIVVCEHQSFSIEYSVAFSEKAPATLNKVYFTGHDIPGFEPGSIISTTQADPDELENFTDGIFYFLAGDQLHMAHLQQKPYLIPRHLPVEGTPAKILYSNYLKKLIALYTRIKIIQPRQINGHLARAPQRALRPVITFLDPDSDPVKHDPDDIDDQGCRFLGECNPGEKVLGMMEWFPLENDDKTYPLLVLNTLAKQPGQDASGRLLMYAMRQGMNGEISLDLKINLEFESPVYAVASHGRSSLVYGCGNELVLRRLVMHPSKKWNEPVAHAMASPAAHISVHDSDVYVTTTKSSLSIFKIEGDNIISLFNDQVARNGLHHLEVPNDSLTVVSGRDCTVTGLWKPPKPRIDNSMCTVFQAVLPGSITRFRRITPADWYHGSLALSSLKASTKRQRPSLKANSSVSISHEDRINDSPLSEKSEAIIGASADGTLYQFDVMDEPSWRLLRYIQNMVMQDPIVCPFHDQFGRRNIEPSVSNNRSMHIDGDILHQLLDRGGEAQFTYMLDHDGEGGMSDMMDLDLTNEESDEAGPTESRNVSVRRSRLGELAADVRELADCKEDVAAVVQWIRFKLLRAL